MRFRRSTCCWRRGSGNTCVISRSDPKPADDLLQETFLRIHQSRAAYNPAYAVKPWVFGLARNVFLMNRRAARRWAEVHESREVLPEFPVPPAVENLGSKNEIRRCIAGLFCRPVGSAPASP